jgi:hypothetical protein
VKPETVKIVLLTSGSGQQWPGSSARLCAGATRRRISGQCGASFNRMAERMATADGENRRLNKQLLILQERDAATPHE